MPRGERKLDKALPLDGGGLGEGDGGREDRQGELDLQGSGQTTRTRGRGRASRTRMTDDGDSVRASPPPQAAPIQGEGGFVVPKPKKPRAKPSTAKPAPKRKPARRKSPRRKPSPLRQRLELWRRRLRDIAAVYAAVPPQLRTLGLVITALFLAATVNLVYQVVRKPAEMFFPVSGVLKKMPADTWTQYAPFFRAYSTALVSPELLAALAQVEGAGDPVAHTYWRWRLTLDLFSVYRPASSAVGMYQMTDPAFADARHYCVRRHAVVAEGAWNDWHACWFNDLYTRVIPSHAIELTAVSLDRGVRAILAHYPDHKITPQQKQQLAAMIHLCGAGPARTFAQRGFKLADDERCGDHSAALYVGRVEAMIRQFQKLAEAEASPP